MKGIVVCPICGNEVEVKEGNCWRCLVCGCAGCGIDEDMIVE